MAFSKPLETPKLKHPTGFPMLDAIRQRKLEVAFELEKLAIEDKKLELVEEYLIQNTLQA